MAEPALSLGWLALAHIGADFVMQTNEIATDKFAHGGRGWWGLIRHVIGVAVLLAPVALAYGQNGLWALVAITLAHAVIDRTKIVLTRRAEALAMATAHRLHEPPAPEASLGRSVALGSGLLAGAALGLRA